MDSERTAKNTLLSVAGSALPAVWRRCADLLTGSTKGKTEGTELSLLAPPGESGSVPDWKRPAMVGYFVIFLAFGVLGGWSAFARLDSAVQATGTVTLESSKKVIQHFEGGIVAKILVNEGEHVDQGQILFLLENTQAQASANAVTNQLAAALAQEARLIAERDNAQQVTYPPELMNKISQPVVQDAMNDENKQFAERRASLAGQIAILKSRIEQFKTQIGGLTHEKAATEEQLNFINSELVDLRNLLEKHLVQKTRVLALERERARLEGVVGQSVAEIAKAENSIGEARLQIEQSRKKFSEEVNTQILEVRVKISDLRQRTIVSQDVLHRIQIRAPRDGTIQNLRVATIGGVIRPAEPLAELVQDDDNLVVNAQVSPSDVDAIEAGMQAEVRFNAFHGTTLPLIPGKVKSVSRDRIVDEQTKQPYFLARIVVDKNDVPTIVKDRIRAGMQVEVVVPTGERTVISYLVRPLRTRASSAFKEK